MKQCPNCAASNPDSARYCSECGRALAATGIVEPPPPAAGGLDAHSIARTLASRAGALQGQRKADILFVLDCTGSMQGEIDAVRDGIFSFVDSIKTEGVRARAGLNAFRDRLINEEAQVLSFGGSVFTDQPDAFRREVSLLSASGGGDRPERSLDALLLAARQPFVTDGEKVIVLITDAPPHIPDRETRSVEQLVVALGAAGISQCYPMIRTEDSDSQVYLKLLEGRKGLVFELGKGEDFRTRAEHFKRALMQLG